MAVQGEWYFALMMHMHFLCFLTARRLLHLPAKPGRMLLACFFASLYSLLSLLPGLPLGNGILTALSLLLSALIAFGSNGFAACLPLGISGFCYGGLCAFLAGQGMSVLPSLCLCTLLCLLIKPRKDGLRAQMEIIFRGKRCRLPAFYDTGNRLHHPVLSLPVIIASEKKLKHILPETFRADDVSTLPRSFFLLPVSTVSGKSLLMAFRPDSIRLLPENRHVDALIAVTPQSLPQALLPHTLQPKEVQAPWKRKIPSGKRCPPSVNG